MMTRFFGDLPFSFVFTLAITFIGLPLADSQETTGQPEQCTQETCGEYGTTVVFAESPAEAARQALEEEKLVLVLHVSGNFETPDYTWNNAEALRVNALANPEVGKFINEHFVSAFQKVGTFRIVGRQKQGGNVASWFCAQDGRVLHVVAGPVNAATLLAEARWVVDTVKKSLAETEKHGTSFKAQFRKAHAERLRQEHGLMVEAVTFDVAAEGEQNALSYRDPSGKQLAPRLPPPPVAGPDVSFNEAQLAEFNARQDAARKTASDIELVGRGTAGDRRRGWVLGNQGRVHVLLAAHAMKKIETVYGSVFEGILGERVSTKPVIVDDPFPWVQRGLSNGQLQTLEVRGR